MSEINETKVRNRDVVTITENRKLKLLAAGNALGLRLVGYTDRISAEQYLEDGMPFGTDLGANDLEASFVPLLSSNHDGTLRYQPAGAVESVTLTNTNLIATRKRLERGWTTCTMLIVFPDDSARYREISQLQAARVSDDTYSADEIYMTLTLQWLNHFIDFDASGRQIIPRAFIGGFVDLDSKELIRNIHYSESFMQTEEARRRLPGPN